MPYFSSGAKDSAAPNRPVAISHRSNSGSRRPTLASAESSLSAGHSSGNGSSNAQFGGKRLSSDSKSSGTTAKAPGSETRRSRPKSIGLVITNNIPHTNQYLSQERMYLKRIRNQAMDDYYTKRIGGGDAELKESDTSNNDEDEEEEGLLPYGNSDFLTDLDEDKYQIDYSLAFDIMKRTNSKLSIDHNVKTISKDTVEDPGVLERLEWQAMLSSVLNGDVVRSEKTKIIDNANHVEAQESFLQAHYKENLWYGIRAKLFDRSEDDQRKNTLYRRTQVDLLIEEILNYEVSYEVGAKSPRDQVAEILDRYDKACELWRTLEEMKHDKPACRTEAFHDRIDALTAWLNIADGIARNTKSFIQWIGNDELDVTKGVQNRRLEDEVDTLSLTRSRDSKVKQIFEEDNKSLADKIVKEKDVHTVFRKRIFTPLAPWIVKSKETYITLGHMFEVLKLPDYGNQLLDLCLVPMRLIKEIITIRMALAKKLENPTLMMIDQMIDDMKSYITIALEVKGGIMDFCKPDLSKTWIIEDLFEKDMADFDTVVLLCVRYFLVLLNKKLVDSSRSPYLFRTNKEPEELEDAWNYLKCLGDYIDGGSMVVAENVISITSRLCLKLLAYLNHQVRNPPRPAPGSTDLLRWYNSTTENFGQLRRKLARFTGEMSRSFTNSFIFEVPGHQTKSILDILKATNHFLVYTGSSEMQGMYFFACPELQGKENEILQIISGGFIGVDASDTFNEFTDLINSIKSESYYQTPYASDSSMHSNDAYLIALCPPKPIVGQLILVTGLSYNNIQESRERFVDLVSGSLSMNGIVKPLEQRSSVTKLHQEMTRINKMFFRMTLAIFDSVDIVIQKCKELTPGSEYQELVNQFFIYARDFGKSAVRWSDQSRSSVVIMRLIHLSIQWVSFICDDCIPTDRKTFRWCVLALEFAMEMTKGFNVLVLNEGQFDKLKLKVARCMSLLISHFDIMGARSSEAEKRRLLKWTSQRQSIENANDDESVLELYQHELMEQIDEIEKYRTDIQEQLNSVGRVLDITDLEYLFVTLLASSFSSVSIRWQKGKFIGGGSFGQVYAAVNLDTGGVMAVKEIVFHDTQSLKLIPSIKEEMTVLEMLNHPNVVQYFGVEVHRDKVYIFMEFCEGGSLSGLLAHGRIEDEMVIQVYTLQMLEGLAYLHQSGVVHRDIKPENILLDHNGVIKFVDFGAAKVIAASGRTRNTTKQSSGTNNNQENLNSMTGTPMYMSPEVITGQSSSKNGVVDIWSLGCCVLEMATGRRPWANLDNEWAIMYHIAAGHKPQLPSADQLSEAGRRFIARCLEHAPQQRPSAAELLHDPWIVQIRQVAFGSSESGNTPLSEVGPDTP
ncbi:CIC11C00000003847 [Sungouiella intermedia]|uniref:MAP kinase kinase kinase n=1 Tax=Sungouiella intermedia TaxID=45354 RepID=A0A1L0BWI4_9ASCO|nr:CIC11C00000003847 [[Candida] intermedia]